MTKYRHFHHESTGLLAATMASQDFPYGSTHIGFSVANPNDHGKKVETGLPEKICKRKVR